MKKREFIVQDLLSKIYQEEFSAGKLQPKNLAQTYGVSRFTIQQAIKTLKRSGSSKWYKVQGFLSMKNGSKPNDL